MFENFKRKIDKSTFEPSILIEDKWIPATALYDLPKMVDRDEFQAIVTAEFGESICKILCEEIYE